LWQGGSILIRSFGPALSPIAFCGRRHRTTNHTKTDVFDKRIWSISATDTNATTEGRVSPTAAL
jgi:hypothetical protein